MTAAAERLDHIGLAVRDLEASSAAFERLGFRLTPPARQSGPLGPGGPVVPWGSGNRCAMLRQGYIEILGTLDPALYDNELGRFLARYEGIHILALGVADAAAQLPRLAASGFPGLALRPMQRPIETPKGESLARFRRVPLPEAPEGRIQLIEHETPELLWQEHLLEHPNRATALVETMLCVADPGEAAERLGRLAGIAPAVADGGRVIAFASGRVVICDPPALASRLPGVVPPTLPWFASLTVATADFGAAEAWLRRCMVPFRSDPGRLVVPPEAAAGAACVFVAAEG